jgi:hypothetical protein
MIGGRDVTDNKPLTDYLATVPYYALPLAIGKTPLTPKRPMHVWGYSKADFHISKVTWFDE